MLHFNQPSVPTVLFDHYLIIVRLLFSILIVEKESRYFDPVKK
jgi:hypothetical protein